MSSTHPMLVRFEPRSWKLDFCLAITALLLWNLLGTIEIGVGFAADPFRSALDVRGWLSQWPWLPWILAAIALTGAFLRCRSDQTAYPSIQSMLRRVTYVCGAVFLLKLLSLWNPAGYVLPYLSLLWSPHANWALNASFLLPVITRMPAHWMRDLRLLSNARVAVAAFLLSAITFCGYTLYFCQITMLHGDEGQYLLVTQSLIQDGDMDLTNNIQPEKISEFHVLDSFGIHKAPGSPSGKIHSVHPIGLSILLVPAYMIGLDLWDNPRLGCALTVSLMAAGCVSLMLAWLLRLQIPRWAAVAAATSTAVTGPFFLYTTQLFPDLPGLLLILIALCSLAHWQLPGGTYRSWGRWEVLWLALLSATLAFLPFLHARFAPVALLAGIGVLMQVRHNPNPRAAWTAVTIVFVFAIVSLLRFNIAFSGDWLGPFRPGNAWGEGAIDIGTWWTSLPGHWLHGGVGLINSSPIYLFSPLGLAVLAKMRDRRLAIGLGVYLMTAAVNGMHPDWKFGFCFPARFLVTSLPCLVLGLAMAFTQIVRRPGLSFFFLFALAISLESIWINIQLTEESYQGNNLFARTLNHYYPWQAHFNSDETSGFLAETVFVILLLAGLFAPQLGLRLERRWTRPIFLVATSLIPTAWGQLERTTSRLNTATSHFIGRLKEDSSVKTRMAALNLPVKPLGFPLAEDGSIEVNEGRHGHGLVARSYMPNLEPGTYVLKLPDLRVEHEGSTPPAHLLLLRRETVHAKSIWETRMSLPLHRGSSSPELIFHINRTALGYTYLHFSGLGSTSLKRAILLYAPGFGTLKTHEIHRVVGSERPSPDAPLAQVARFPALEAGSYALTAELSGTTAHTLFHPSVRYVAGEQSDEHPDLTSPPIALAVFVEAGEPAVTEARIRSWFGSKRDLISVADQTHPVVPLIETVQPPWWLAVPVLGAEKFRLDFSLFKGDAVWVALKYAGSLDISIDHLVLTQITPPHRRPTD